MSRGGKSGNSTNVGACFSPWEKREEKRGKNDVKVLEMSNGYGKGMNKEKAIKYEINVA